MNPKSMDNSSINFVIAGGSFAAISAVRILTTSTIPGMLKTNPKVRTQITIITPNTHSFWNIASPRIVIDFKWFKENESRIFFNLKNTVTTLAANIPGCKVKLIQANVASINQAQNKIVVRKINEPDLSDSLDVKYSILILATGARSSLAPFKALGSTETTKAGLCEMSHKIKTANSICIVGAGAVGIELAGELGHAYGKTKKITLFSGINGTLESLKRSSQDVTKRLTNLGVKTVLDVRAVCYYEETSEDDNDSAVLQLKTVPVAQPNSDLRALSPSLDSTLDSNFSSAPTISIQPPVALSTGRTVVEFDNGYKESFDLFLATTGNKPNTSYLPRAALDSLGFVRVDAFLRLESASNPHGNVYAIGDIVSGGKQTLVDLLENQTKTLLRTLHHDLIQESKSLKKYKPSNPAYIVPVSKKGGVGIYYGIPIPSLLVSVVKGKDFLIGKAGGFLDA